MKSPITHTFRIRIAMSHTHTVQRTIEQLDIDMRRDAMRASPPTPPSPSLCSWRRARLFSDSTKQPSNWRLQWLPHQTVACLPCPGAGLTGAHAHRTQHSRGGVSSITTRGGEWGVWGGLSRERNPEIIEYNKIGKVVSIREEKWTTISAYRCH